MTSGGCGRVVDGSSKSSETPKGCDMVEDGDGNDDMVEGSDLVARMVWMKRRGGWCCVAED